MALPTDLTKGFDMYGIPDVGTTLHELLAAVQEPADLAGEGSGCQAVMAIDSPTGQSAVVLSLAGEFTLYCRPSNRTDDYVLVRDVKFDPDTPAGNWWIRYQLAGKPWSIKVNRAQVDLTVDDRPYSAYRLVPASAEYHLMHDRALMQVEPHKSRWSYADLVTLSKITISLTSLMQRVVQTKDRNDQAYVAGLWFTLQQHCNTLLRSGDRLQAAHDDWRSVDLTYCYALELLLAKLVDQTTLEGFMQADGFDQRFQADLQLASTLLSLVLL